MRHCWLARNVSLGGQKNVHLARFPWLWQDWTEGHFSQNGQVLYVWSGCFLRRIIHPNLYQRPTDSVLICSNLGSMKLTSFESQLYAFHLYHHCVGGVLTVHTTKLLVEFTRNLKHFFLTVLMRSDHLHSTVNVGGQIGPSYLRTKLELMNTAY